MANYNNRPVRSGSYTRDTRNTRDNAFKRPARSEGGFSGGNRPSSSNGSASNGTPSRSYGSSPRPSYGAARPSYGGSRPSYGSKPSYAKPGSAYRASFRSRPGARFGRGNQRSKSFNVFDYINSNPVAEEKSAPYIAKNTFSSFVKNQNLVEIIKNCGYVNPTQIQDTIIPHIIEGKDVVGLANTGTGKTAAFLIPLIDKVLHNRDTEVLILAPTRELAIQIERELKNLTQKLPIFSVTCVGGVPIYKQLGVLRRKTHFIIGTPGRVLDLIKRKAIRIEKINNLILDEADQMLDMGFIGDIRTIISGIPSDRQTLFFSATMSKTIETLIYEFLKNPVNVSVKTHDITTNIHQDVVRIGKNDKIDLLIQMLSKEEFKRVLVFGRTKSGVEKLYTELKKKGLLVESIHGNKSHSQRQKSLGRFKFSEVKILVATDVAARGLHIDNVSHVINYDLPSTYEDYVHRIGRTGRCENKGKAITFVS